LFSSSAQSREERLLLPDLGSATAEVEEDGTAEREEGPGRIPRVDTGTYTMV
jgi:hypothetical protein